MRMIHSYYDIINHEKNDIKIANRKVKFFTKNSNEGLSLPIYRLVLGLT